MCLRETAAIAHCLLVAGALAGVNDGPYIVAPAAISFSPYEESGMDFDHRPPLIRMTSSNLRCLLDNADFLVRQAVELVDELVDLLVGRVNLALDNALRVRRRARL